MKALSSAQLDSYLRSGYLVLPGLISPSDLAELSREYDELFIRKKEEKGRLEATWGGDWRQESKVLYNNSTITGVSDNYKLTELDILYVLKPRLS